MTLDHSARRRKSETRSTVLCREERLEHLLSDIRRDPRTLICNRDSHAVIAARHGDTDDAARPLRLSRAQQQIEKDGTQLVGVRLDQRVLPTHFDRDVLLYRIAS